MSFRLRRSHALLGILSVSALVACGGGEASSDGAPAESTQALQGTDQFAEPEDAAGCTVKVDTDRELMITDLKIVEDAARTSWSGGLSDPKDGAWSFGRLMTSMAGKNDPQDFVRSWLASWEAKQTINSFDVLGRSIKVQILDKWPLDGKGKLDLAKAPFRLSAIANRVDLRNLAAGNAGEGRFVFGLTNGGTGSQLFTLILEYKLLAKDAAEAKAWATLWHGLHQFPLGSPAYNDALQQITDKFAGKNAAPGNINGSAIGQVRTNDFALGVPWELREFRLATGGQLAETTIAQTPDFSLEPDARTGRYINANEASILAGTSSVPLKFERAPFRGAAAPTEFSTIWNPPGVKNNDARQLFSVNTCNGCHGGETQTGFLHIAPRSKGAVTSLSTFLTGKTIKDPVDGEVDRTFNDLARRKKDMQNFLCASPAAVAAQPPNNRVH